MFYLKPLVTPLSTKDNTLLTITPQSKGGTYMNENHCVVAMRNFNQIRLDFFARLRFNWKSRNYKIYNYKIFLNISSMYFFYTLYTFP